MQPYMYTILFMRIRRLFADDGMFADSSALYTKQVRIVYHWFLHILVINLCIIGQDT